MTVPKVIDRAGRSIIVGAAVLLLAVAGVAVAQVASADERGDPGSTWLTDEGTGQEPAGPGTDGGVKMRWTGP